MDGLLLSPWQQGGITSGALSLGERESSRTGFLYVLCRKTKIETKGLFIVYFYFGRVKVNVMFLRPTVIGGYECKHSGRNWFHRLDPPRKALSDQS